MREPVENLGFKPPKAAQMKLTKKLALEMANLLDLSALEPDDPFADMGTPPSAEPPPITKKRCSNAPTSRHG
jgi:hypothetical protein